MKERIMHGCDRGRVPSRQVRIEAVARGTKPAVVRVSEKAVHAFQPAGVPRPHGPVNAFGGRGVGAPCADRGLKGRGVH